VGFIQISDKHIVALLGVLILIVLVLGSILVVGFIASLNSYLDANVYNHTESDFGVSFTYPDNWSICEDDDSENWIVAYPDYVTNSSYPSQIIMDNNTSPFPEQFEVDITHNDIMPYKEAMNKADIFPGSVNKILSSTITVDGTKAYKSVFILNDSHWQAKEECIYFVKNGNTYLLTFIAATEDFDREKKNFDLILNSFKVQ